MLKGRDILDKPVVSYDTGERFCRVKDLVFDQENNQLLGLLVSEAGWLRSAKVVLLKDVQAIGPDAVVVPSKDCVLSARDIPTVERILKRNNILKGTRILTTDGRNLGSMIDLYFDEATGSVEGYEVSGGLFADAYSGRSFVPALQTLKIGEDVAFVPAQTADYMQEQVGGIRGAVQTAGAKAQETAQIAGDRLQVLGQETSERVQAAAEVTGDRLQEFKTIAAEKAQAATEATSDQIRALKASSSERGQAAFEATSGRIEDFTRSANASLTNSMVDPSEQKVFATGKVAQESVVAPDGRYLVVRGQLITPQIASSAEMMGILDMVYRAAGGSLTKTLSDRVGSAVASVGIEQALGKRVQHLVRTDAGLIIAAPGQIVTNIIVERAKTYHQEQAILDAVGLSKGDAVRDRTQQWIGGASSQLRTTGQSTSDQLQSSAKGLWSQVRETANELQGKSAAAIEEQRVKGALGRPVTRVILDRSDGVILNVGELITHQAIASARRADVLDVLLNSVYTEVPKLSLQDLRAPQAGQAALH